MKRLLLLVLLLVLVLDARATPFFFQGHNSDGTAQTNEITMVAWPINTQTWTAVGTNVIYGGQTIVITPNASGYASNWAYPNTYLCMVSNLDAGFYVKIPNTTNFLSLATYITNSPTLSGTYLNGYGLVTNWLTFEPATNSNAGITAALGYTPATNSNDGIQSALGYEPATNSNAGIDAALGFSAATNSNAGIQSALGYEPATNNNAGIDAALGFSAATNSNVGIQAALGYEPATNHWAESSGYVTNNGMIWCATNLATGTSPTLSLPNGSILTGTNGTLYIRTNATWVLK